VQGLFFEDFFHTIGGTPARQRNWLGVGVRRRLILRFKGRRRAGLQIPAGSVSI
jgi:hypothetical protein